jgi:hypothetical protein
MSPTRLAASATFAAAAVLAAFSLRPITGATDRRNGRHNPSYGHGGNTATSLGPWDECIIASPGDTLTIDVTATNIPASNPIIAFEYRLNYPAEFSLLSLQTRTSCLPICPAVPSFNLSDPVPDGDGLWYAGVADFTGPHENGSGVLDRMTLSVAPGAAPGV